MKTYLSPPKYNTDSGWRYTIHSFLDLPQTTIVLDRKKERMEKKTQRLEKEGIESVGKDTERIAR
jgi:hypothetical protein